MGNASSYLPVELEIDLLLDLAGDTYLFCVVVVDHHSVHLSLDALMDFAYDLEDRGLVPAYLAVPSHVVLAAFRGHDDGLDGSLRLWHPLGLLVDVQDEHLGDVEPVKKFPNLFDVVDHVITPQVSIEPEWFPGYNPGMSM